MRALDEAGATPGGRAPRSSPSQVVRFVALSGTGWLLDVCLFLGLVGLGVPAGPANAASASAAVLFVFTASHGAVFDGRSADRGRDLVAYAVYQVVLVLLVSAAIGLLVRSAGVPPLVAKVGLTPFTLVSNFLVLRRIVSTPRAVQPGTSEVDAR